MGLSSILTGRHSRRRSDTKGSASGSRPSLSQVLPPTQKLHHPLLSRRSSSHLKRSREIASHADVPVPQLAEFPRHFKLSFCPNAVSMSASTSAATTATRSEESPEFRTSNERERARRGRSISFQVSPCENIEEDRELDESIEALHKMRLETFLDGGAVLPANEHFPLPVTFECPIQSGQPEVAQAALIPGGQNVGLALWQGDAALSEVGRHSASVVEFDGYPAVWGDKCQSNTCDEATEISGPDELPRPQPCCVPGSIATPATSVAEIVLKDGVVLAKYTKPKLTSFPAPPQQRSPAGSSMTSDVRSTTRVKKSRSLHCPGSNHQRHLNDAKENREPRPKSASRRLDFTDSSYLERTTQSFVSKHLDLTGPFKQMGLGHGDLLFSASCDDPRSLSLEPVLIKTERTDSSGGRQISWELRLHDCS